MNSAFSSSATTAGAASSLVSIGVSRHLCIPNGLINLLTQSHGFLFGDQSIKPEIEALDQRVDARTKYDHCEAKLNQICSVVHVISPLHSSVLPVSLKFVSFLVLTQPGMSPLTERSFYDHTLC